MIPKGHQCQMKGTLLTGGQNPGSTRTYRKRVSMRKRRAWTNNSPRDVLPLCIVQFLHFRS